MNIKYFHLPILILFTSILLNIPNGNSIPSLLIHASLQTALIWGLLVSFNGNILLRLILAIILAIELFSRTAYGGSLSLSMVMSLLDATANEVYSTIKFNLYPCVLSLIFVSGMLFFKTVKRNTFSLYMLITGLVYLSLPLVINSPNFFSSQKFDNYIKTGLARGYSRTYTSVEFLIKEDLGLRFPPLNSLRGISDAANLLSLHINSDSSWTEVNTKDSSPKILVLGIGESLRAENMGLYGYHRKTTPYLSKLQHNITVYEEAYAAGTNTWSALPAALTKVSGTPDLSKSIINLAKDAGYTTFWFSNHARFSKWDFSVSSIAAQADNVHFVSQEKAGLSYDASLIPILEDILASNVNEEKLFIVLHFYGSHMSFIDRYPPEFANFNSTNISLDEYDNSILYTDFVQKEVLQMVSKYGGEYLFFADHGLGDPKGAIPLKHDVRDEPSLSSIRVPFFTSHNSNLILNREKAHSLYYFECIFSLWSGISAAELEKDDYCNETLNKHEITFVDSNLVLQQKQTK